MNLKSIAKKYLPVKNTRYNSVAQALHWIIGLAIIGMLICGIFMTDMPKGDTKMSIYQWHKSIGITILILSVMRLVWRLLHKAPAYPKSMKLWERAFAHTTHAIFYILMIATPLSGWAMTSAGGYPIKFYGLFSIPSLPVMSFFTDKHLAHEITEMAHQYFAYAIIGLLVLHIGAALKHHFVNRDDVVFRMMPRFIQKKR